MSDDVGSLKATYTADSATFQRETDKAEKAARRLEGQVKKLADELSGGRAQRGMDTLEKAVAKAGGTAKLSEAGLALVEKRIRSLESAGAKVPASLQGITKELTALQKVGVQLKDGFLSGVGLGAGFGAVTVGVQALASAVLSLPAAGAAAVRSYIDQGGALNDLSTQTQVAVGALQELTFAGTQSGVGQSELVSAIEKTKNALIEAPERVRALGLSVEDLLQQDPGEAFTEVAQAVAAIESPALRTKTAMDLWGKSGPVILRMAGDLQELRKRAEELGLSFDEKGVKAADALGDALGEVSTASEALKMALVDIVADNPEFIDFLKDSATAIGAVARSAREGKDELQKLLSVWSSLPGGLPFVGTGLAQAGSLSGIAADVARNGVSLGFAGMSYSTAGPAYGLKGKGSVEQDPLALSAEQIQKAKAAANDLADAWAKVREAQLKAAPGLDSALQLIELSTQKQIRDVLALKDVSEAYKNQRIAAIRALAAEEEKAAEKLHTLQTRRMPVFMPQVPDTLPTKGGPQPVYGMGALAPLPNQISHGISGAGLAAREIADAADAAEKLKRKQDDLRDATQRWQQALAAVSDTFRLLGINSDSFLGRTLGGMQALASSTGLLKQGMLGKDGTSSIGNLFKGGFSNVLTNVSGALSAGIAAFSVGKAIFGLFHKSEAEKAADEAGKHLGVKVSEALAKEIQKQAKALHITIGDAALLNITKAATESGKSVSMFAPQLGQLMQLVAKGGPAAAAGVEELNRAWSELEKEAEAGSRAAQQSMTLLLLQAERSGVRVKAIVEYVKREATSGSKGLAGVFGALADADASKARLDLYGTAALSYVEALKAQGLTLAQIFDLVGDSLDAAAAAYEKLGLEIPPALAEIIAKRDVLADNAPLKAITEGSRAVLESLDHLGRLSAEQLRGMAQDAGQQFEDWTKAFEEKGFEHAAAQAAALEVMAPNLMLLRDLAREYGIELDANTQALIEQAETAGLFDNLRTPQEEMIDLQQQQVVLLGLLVQAMGVQLPDAIQKAINKWRELNGEAEQTRPPTGPNGPLHAPGGDDGSGPIHPLNPGGTAGGAAHGAVGQFGAGTPMTLHGHEVVAPVASLFGTLGDSIARRVANLAPDMSGVFAQSQALQFAAAGAGGMGGGGASIPGPGGRLGITFAPQITAADARSDLRRFRRWLETDEDQIVGDIQRGRRR